MRYISHRTRIQRRVAILILLESFLQFIKNNLYTDTLSKSQSLFYWNPFCNIDIGKLPKLNQKSRNPYFIGILSAIWCSVYLRRLRGLVAILILLESFLQLKLNYIIIITLNRRNPYFIGILSAIKVK